MTPAKELAMTVNENQTGALVTGLGVGIGGIFARATQAQWNDASFFGDAETDTDWNGEKYGKGYPATTLIVLAFIALIAMQEMAGESGIMGTSTYESPNSPYQGECFGQGSSDFDTVYATMVAAQQYATNSGWTGDQETFYQNEAGTLAQQVQQMADNDSAMQALVQQQAETVSQTQLILGSLQAALFPFIAVVALLERGGVNAKATAWIIAVTVSSTFVPGGGGQLANCAAAADQIAAQVDNIDYGSVQSAATGVSSDLSSAMTSSTAAASTPSSASTSPASAATASPPTASASTAPPAGALAGGGAESPQAPDKAAVSTPDTGAAYAAPGVAAGAGQPGGVTAPQAGPAPGQVNPTAAGFTTAGGAGALAAPPGGATTTAAPQQGKPARPAPTGDTPDTPDAPAALQSTNSSTDTLAAAGAAGAERAPIESSTPAPAQTPAPTPAEVPTP